VLQNNGPLPRANIDAWQKRIDNGYRPSLVSYSGETGKNSKWNRDKLITARLHLAQQLKMPEFDPGHPSVNGVHCLITDCKLFGNHMQSGRKTAGTMMKGYDAEVLLDDSGDICHEAEAAGITCIQIRTDKVHQDVWRP